MAEVAAAYAGCRARIAALVAGLDAARATTPVPTCPGWSVHDVVAHMAGVVDDALAGRLDGLATDPWTAAQVDARRDLPVASIVAEWEAKAPAFEELLDGIGDPGRQAVTDLVTHEHDLRTALHQPGARSSDAVLLGVGFVASALVDAAAERGASLLVRSADGRSFGPLNAVTVLTGDPFALLRAMTGRRSPEQLRALAWQGPVEAVLGAFEFGPFRPAASPIDE